MEVLRELAVAIVAGSDSTGELTPAPEAERRTGARENGGPVNCNLPIRFAVGKRRRRRASDNRHRKEADDCKNQHGPAKTSQHPDPPLLFARQEPAADEPYFLPTDFIARRRLAVKRAVACARRQPPSRSPPLLSRRTPRARASLLRFPAAFPHPAIPLCKRISATPVEGANRSHPEPAKAAVLRDSASGANGG